MRWIVGLMMLALLLLLLLWLLLGGRRLGLLTVRMRVLMPILGWVNRCWHDSLWTVFNLRRSTLNAQCLMLNGATTRDKTRVV